MPRFKQDQLNGNIHCCIGGKMKTVYKVWMLPEGKGKTDIALAEHHHMAYHGEKNITGILERRLVAENPNVIIVRASTNSVWDSCQYAIIDLSRMTSQWISECLSVIQVASKNDAFLALKYYTWGGKFFANLEDIPGIDMLINEQSTWAYIDIGDEACNSLEQPINNITSWRIIICADCFYFEAGAKSFNEQYETALIPLQVLRDRVKMV